MNTDDAPNQSCERCGAPLSPHDLDGLCTRCVARCSILTDLSEPGTGFPDRHEPASPRSAPSPRFGDYELLDEIARGGMGVVYRARQLSLDRIVAVKMLLLGQFAAPGVFQRFRAEAESAAKLQHPNIVAIHDIGEQDAQPFFSMDYVAGRNLGDLVRDRPLPARAAAQYLVKIARAVQYAHEHGILHRDLKPANILIDEADEPRITDFGLAKRLAPDPGTRIPDSGSSPPPSASGIGHPKSGIPPPIPVTPDLTLSGQVLGSPNFLPPEQAGGHTRAIGPACDIYGLGAVLYYLLTARPPFVAETFESTLFHVLNSDPVPPRELNPSVPLDLETICLKCLEKEPGRRYSSAKELGEELDRFLRDEPIRARRIGRVARTWRWCQRKPALAAMTAAVVLAVAAGFTGVFWQWRRAQGQAEVTRLNLYASDTYLAHRASLEHNLGRARALLQSHRPTRGQRDLRGFEWRYLWEQTRGDDVFTYRGHSNIVSSAVFSPDGRLVASRGFDNRVHIQDFATRKPLVILEGSGKQTETAGDDASQNAVGFSSDGRFLAAIVFGRTLVWEVPTWRLAKELPGPAWAVAFNPQEPELAVNGRDGVTVWNIRDWSRERHFDYPASEWQGGLTFSPDGTVLAALTFQMLVAWDLRSSSQTPVFTNVLQSAFSVACSDELLAVGDWYGRVRVWDWRSWKPVADFPAHSMFAFGLAFSPSGEVLATGGGDQLVRLWDTRTFQSQGSLRGHEHEVWSIRFSPDRRWLLTAGKDDTVRLWPLESPPRQLNLRGAWKPLWFSRDSREMLAVNFEREIDRWGLPSGQHLGRLTLADGPSGPASPERRWAISADGQRLAISETDNQLRLWASGGAKLLHRLCSAKPVTKLVLSPSGQYLAASTDEPCVRVWDFDSGGEVLVLRDAGPYSAFSADDRLLAVERPPYSVAVYTLPTGRLVTTLPPHHWTVTRLAFAPDGRTLLSPSGDNTVRFWDTRTWRLDGVLRGDLGGVVSVTLSPDGRTLATWSADQTLRLWHYATRKELLSVQTPESDLLFSPDGEWLALGGGYYVRQPGAGMQLWHAPPLAEAERR